MNQVPCNINDSTGESTALYSCSEKDQICCLYKPGCLTALTFIDCEKSLSFLLSQEIESTCKGRAVKLREIRAEARAKKEK